MEIKNVSVIGGGTMGNGIAHVFAMKCFKVNLIEMNSELLEKAVNTISKNLDRQVKKEIMSRHISLSNFGLANFKTSINSNHKIKYYYVMEFS